MSGERVAVAMAASTANEELLGLARERALDDVPCLRLPRGERRRELLRLLDRDVRREGRHRRIRQGLEDDRAIGGERLIPGRTHVAWIVDPDSPEADQLCVAPVRELRDLLSSGIHRIALKDSLLP